MAEANKPAGNVGNVNATGAHDRVAMLRLNADGTVDQTAPELVGEPEFVAEAAKRQFAEQAVSATDVARQAPNPSQVTVVGEPGDKPDRVEPLRSDAGPQFDETRKALEAAQKAGETAAEQTVKALLAEKK
jgi:pectin methylesterase-like acyl-CoA thioesterase